MSVAAARLPSTVVSLVMVGCVPYAATKFTSDAAWRSDMPKSFQSVYGRRMVLPEAPTMLPLNNWRRTSLSGAMPSLRARVMFRVARSRGRPTRLLRSASVTNSSISSPRWFTMPRMTAPAPALASSTPAVPPSVKAIGLRNASIREMSFFEPSALVRATVSVSIEWPKR